MSTDQRGRQPHEGASPRRLSAIDEDKDRFTPWVKAETLEDTHLFWLPVSGFPLDHDQRTWFLAFLERLSGRLAEMRGLRSESFLQYKAASRDLAVDFQRYALQHHVLLGLTRRPGTSLPTFPAEDKMREVLSKGDRFDLEAWVADFCYWLLTRQHTEQRQLFAGWGALTTLFLAPDPRMVVPKLPFTPRFRAAMPVFQRFDVEEAVASAFALQDAFLAKSKQLFGAGLEQEPMYPGVAYIVPLLESGHFFAATPEERASWFSLFEVYVNESPSDKGILLAFQAEPVKDLVEELLVTMREESLVYPLRNGAGAW